MSAKSIVIAGRQVAYEVKDIDIYSVDYYRENPRINFVLSRYPSDQISSDRIEDALLAMDSTKDLIRDIEENRGLLEPVLVLDQKVIEGNTRLCAYRRLHKRTQDDFWRLIKANVISEELSATEVFTILSNYHIRGKRPWDAFEKAACIVKMIAQGQSIDEVARLVGSHRPKVEDMLRAYEAMRASYLPKVQADGTPGLDDRDHIRKYSYFEALYINKKLAERATQTPGFLNEFSEWVAEGRIPKAENVRDLHEVLDNKKACNEFRSCEPEEAFYEAMQVLHYNRPDKVEGFYKSVNHFRDLVRAQNPTLIKDEISENRNKKHILKCCIEDVQRFGVEIGLIEKKK